MEKVANKSSKSLAVNLRNDYIKALKDNDFKKLIVSLELNEKVALKYTSKLEETTAELKNCKNCKGLLFCQNKMEGYVSFPKEKEERLIFSYIACKYKKEQLTKEQMTVETNDMVKASFKDIDLTDKKRLKAINWLMDFHKNYEKGTKIKGLYLHGSFGSGKSYLIAATLNELARNRVRIEIEYFPELIRKLKQDFDNYDKYMEYLQNIDILLIDDIGAEKVTEWSRDEVLGTILQHRMNNHLPTFFTSNLSTKDLEAHLAIANNNSDVIKARRIVQRILQLADELELVSENKRN